MSRTPYRFAQVSDVLTFSHKLSDGAFRTYVMLLRIQGENETAWIGNKALAAERGQSSRTVQRHLQELEDVGAIVRWETAREDGAVLRHVHTEIPGLSEDGFFSAAEVLECAGPIAARWRQKCPPPRQGCRTPHVTSGETPTSPVANIRRAIEGESLKEKLHPSCGPLFEDSEPARKVPPAKPKRKRKAKAKKPNPRALTVEESQEFQRWWATYPRRENVGAARGSWRKARAHFPPGSLGLEQLLSVTRKWCDQKAAEPGFEAKYWPSPVKWLANERWTDELAPTDEDPNEALERAARRTSERYGQ